MKASVAASFAAFLLVGAITLWGRDFRTDVYVAVILRAVIPFSALYYYYLNIAADATWDVKLRAPEFAKLTWWITFAQYFGFNLLWPLLRAKWAYYAAGLFFLNCSYLLWDCLHWKTIRKDSRARWVLGFDIVGACSCLALCLLTLGLPPETLQQPSDAHQAIQASIAGFVVVIVSILGIIMVKVQFGYNPFQYLSTAGNPIFRAIPSTTATGLSSAAPAKSAETPIDG